MTSLYAEFFHLYADSHRVSTVTQDESVSVRLNQATGQMCFSLSGYQNQQDQQLCEAALHHLPHPQRDRLTAKTGLMVLVN